VECIPWDPTRQLHYWNLPSNIRIAYILEPIPGLATYLNVLETEWVPAASLMEKLLSYSALFMQSCFNDIPAEQNAYQRQAQANSNNYNSKLPIAFTHSPMQTLLGLRLFRQAESKHPTQASSLEGNEQIQSLLKGKALHCAKMP
jgi:hypothetical protein